MKIKSFLSVFRLQGGLMLLISSPAYWVNHSQNGPMNLLDLLGITIWFTGFFFQAVADFQLSKFIKNEKQYSGHHYNFF